MAEQLANNAASTLNGGIDNVVGSLTVANGAVFPSSGNFRILVDSELMLCTARSTNTLTVTRGIESTAAASHSNGVAVTHVLTKGGLDTYLTQIPITTSQVSTTGAWSTYTPAWTSSGTAPSLGNGVISGRYIQLGKLVIGRIKLGMGGTTTFGTGTYFLSLPVTAAYSEVENIGAAFGEDSGVAGYHGFTMKATTTTLEIVAAKDASASLWSNTVPFTWGNADNLWVRFIYEAA